MKFTTYQDALYYSKLSNLPHAVRKARFFSVAEWKWVECWTVVLTA